MKKNLIDAEIEGIRTTINLKESLTTLSTITVPYWIGCWDSQLIVVLPGEVTSSLTKKIRNKFNGLIFSIGNDYLFYFAETKLHQAKQYEAQSSFF